MIMFGSSFEGIYCKSALLKFNEGRKRPEAEWCNLCYRIRKFWIN